MRQYVGVIGSSSAPTDRIVELNIKSLITAEMNRVFECYKSLTDQ